MSEESATESITIRTSSEVIAALGKLAEAMDRPRDWVIEAALQSYIDIQSWQVQGIKEALSSLGRGEGLTHEDVIRDLDKPPASHE